jgi:exodeoxyribonuclease-5
MEWSPQQDAALKRIAAWLKRGDQQLFRLFGYAGTGKTTLARQIAADRDGETAFAAFTGKAAQVLRSKGCAEARTIHSLIYRARDRDEEAPTFILNEASVVANADLVVVDECSMVDAELGRDLLSFGKPVLVLGDPAQLPPIKGGGFFTEAEPDVMLTEVHRQAADNPIIRMSMRVREGGRLARGAYGTSRVIGRDAVEPEMALEADQILVGLNRTRRGCNARLRQLLARADPYPEAQDKLVCLRNDRARGLLNGSTWIVKGKAPKRAKTLRFDVVPEDEPARKPLRIRVLPAYFDGAEEDIPWPERRESDAFDYGYALTVHKAQGSQWDDVLLFDEARAFQEHGWRWLYTGLTRAAERVTVVA